MAGAQRGPAGQQLAEIERREQQRAACATRLVFGGRPRLPPRPLRHAAERRPDPIPAGNPKERPSEGGGGDERREAPPAPSPDKK